jgi:small ligand-binding sensory domain FIST
MAVVPERKALVMFEPDLEPGAQVQLMRMSMDLEYVGARVEEALARLDGRRPVLAVYIDCAGRCAAMSTLESEDGHVVRDAIGDIPLLGFYTGVEVAEVRDAVRPLDWTGVLCILSE